MATQVLDGSLLGVVTPDGNSWGVATPDLEPADPHCVFAYVERNKDGQFSALMLTPRPGAGAKCSSLEQASTIVAAQASTYGNGVPGRRRAMNHQGERAVPTRCKVQGRIGCVRLFGGEDCSDVAEEALMGRLTYDSTTTVDFEDRTLAHLQLVVGAKLRRNEAFFLSWKNDTDIGDGRGMLWIHPTIPLYFKFGGSRPPSINRHWIDALMLTANSPGGLRVVPEPASLTHDDAEVDE